MADNTAQGGSAVIAADDVATMNGSASSGVLVQRTKVAFGDDGDSRDVSPAFPLPVTLTSGGTYSVTTVNTSGTANTNTTLLAASATRKYLVVWNRGTDAILLGFGVATTTTLYSVKVAAGTGYEVPPQFAAAALHGQSATATQPVNLSAVS